MTRWCILRTSGGQTLPLARSLRAAGFDVWTPAREIRKVVRRGTRAEKRLEIDIAILPTFVFARETDLSALADAATQPTSADPAAAVTREDDWVPRIGDCERALASISPYPQFSIFRHGGRIPLISDREVAGLQEEEREAAATMQAMRDAETREEAERIRIAAIRSESARRRAMKEMERARLADLRAQRQALQAGTQVDVAEMPALAGVTGVVESSDGVFAQVRFGTQSWKIEGWRLTPHESA